MRDAERHGAGSTRGTTKSDTMLAKSADSDTLARSSPGRSRAAGDVAAARQKLSLLQPSVGIWLRPWPRLAGWPGWRRAGGNRPQQAVEARQRALQVAAQYASSEILKEINRRFDILNQFASDAELRQQMVRIKEKPTDEALWKRLEDWLGARKADHAKDAVVG